MSERGLADNPVMLDLQFNKILIYKMNNHGEMQVAVALEFINFIVPIFVIKMKYPGGWGQCLKDHDDLIGETLWYDDYLLRNGAMSSVGIEDLVKYWTELGLTPISIVEGKRTWSDCCVIEHMFGGLTLDCSWIGITEDGRAAFLKGTEPGSIVGRTAF